MLPAIMVFIYLAVVLYIGIFAFRRSTGSGEDFFLANRSLGQWVFLFSLFGTNMTAFAILGSSGLANQRGIGVYGLMASASGLVIPLTLLLIGTRLWGLGKRFGHTTQVEYLRDRWQCSILGTAIFALTAAMLVPYIVIGVMGGGTVMQSLSTPKGGTPWISYEVGGAIVAVVVMSYVFFGGMRGTAWVNTFQTILFLCFGAIAVVLISRAIGGFGTVMERIAADPVKGALLARDRIPPQEFLSYMFIPLSSIMFPHIAIMCMTAERVTHFKKTVILYPLCIMAIWLPCVYLGVTAAGLEPFKALGRGEANNVIPLMLAHYSPEIVAGILGAGIMACVMASDSQILALGTMFTKDIFAHYGMTRRWGARAEMWTARGFVVAIALFSYVVAIALKDKENIFELAIRFAFSGFAALAPVMLAALFWKRSTAPAAFCAVLWVAATMIGSWWLHEHSAELAKTLKPGQTAAIFPALGGLFLRSVGGVTVYGYLPVMFMCLGSGAIMVVVSLITKAPPQHIIDKYFPPKPQPGAVAA